MDPRLRKQDPHTPRYAQRRTPQGPSIRLEYDSDLTQQTQDTLTACIAVDLHCDLGIDTEQPNCDTLLFETEQHRTVAMLYISRYDRVKQQHAQD